MPEKDVAKRGVAVRVDSAKSTNDDEPKSKVDLPLFFLKPLDPKYQCAVCSQLLRHPLQFEECGHRCCSSCLPELLRVTARCPLDQAKVTRNNTFVDKPLVKEIEWIAMKCSNHVAGCKWKGILKDLYPHDDECLFSIMSCLRKCGAKFEKRFLTKHQKEDCPKRDSNCEHCREIVCADEMLAHLNVCRRYPVYCPNECSTQYIPREELDGHLDKHCTQRDVPCPFTECGCDFRSARKVMGKHIREEPIKHLTMVGKTAGELKKLIQAHSDTLDKHGAGLDKSTRSVSAFEKLYGAQLIWRIDGYEQKLEEAKTGKKTIYSPPFLSHRNGYKLVMSANLNGDGKARDKNMSLYICVCKGDFDALLVWPFSHKITFTLIDQCQDPAARKNITYSVKPNTSKENKQYLGRPTEDKNANFGAQKFCELSLLKTLDYIRDDTMYIKVSIDTDSMMIV